MQEPPKDEKPQDSEKHTDQQCHSLDGGSTEHQDDGHPDHKKSIGRSRSKSRSRSPHGSCSPPPQSDRVHSGDRAHADDMSRNKDHRSDCGPYYSDDHDRYHPSYDRYCEDRYYNFNPSRYYDWGYHRRYVNRGRYWSPCRSPPCRSPNHSRPDDLRDRCSWDNPGFRDRQDHSGSFDNRHGSDNHDNRHHRSTHNDSRDHCRSSSHHDRCSKSPIKSECSQSRSPEYKE